MPSSHRIIVTCGPASEPIDEVRRITNFSTGELGSLLSDRLAEHGWKILCLRGAGATFPPPVHAHVLPFSTNADLEDLLHQFSSSSIIGVFHTAALSDFHLLRTENNQGTPITSPKFNSRSGKIRLILTPAPKIIQKLRDWFPHSKIVGWKYELEGSPENALARGIQQIQESKTDACVVNGRAWGNNFAFLEKENLPPTILPNKSQLCTYLSQWLTR